MKAWWKGFLLLVLAGSSIGARAMGYAFVQLGPTGPQARVVTTEKQCPVLTVDGRTFPMSLRVGASGASSGNAFPLKVCELHLPVGAREVKWGDQALPTVHPEIHRIVLLGDTGCRLKAPFLYQACNDSDKWPLARLAISAAREKPDLVIHVGDYHYRESPCIRPACMPSPSGYGWDAWQADFFSPVQPLLEAAPWVFVRGNHESCKRAGQGWFRLLDPYPFDAQQDCTPDTARDKDVTEPYAVSLGPDRQLIVFDSAAVSEKPPGQGDAQVLEYARQFEEVARLASRKPDNWLVMHHPVLGYGYLPVLGYEKGNPVLAAALEMEHYAGLFPPGIQFTLDGHVHTFELSRFPAPVPVNLITGFGGALLEEPFPKRTPSDFQPVEGVNLLESQSTQQFGYTVLEEHSGRWTLYEKDVQGNLRRTCELQLNTPPYGFDCSAGVLPAAWLKADYLLLGEVHDNKAGHQLRLSWLRQMAVQHGERVLALEQFDLENQWALDQGIRKGLPPRQVAENAHFNFHGWQWPLYEPVLQLAMDQKWPVAAANLSRAQMGDLMRGKGAPTPYPESWGADQREAQLKEVREGHCNLMPEDQLPMLASAQRARDRAMAETLVRLHKKTGLPVVLLAGNGHTRKDLGVPAWLRQMDPEAQVISVGTLEKDRVGKDESRLFDEVYWVNPEPREDPCKVLMKRLKRNDNGVGGDKASGSRGQVGG